MYSHFKAKLLVTTFFILLVVGQGGIVAHAHDPAGFLPDRLAILLGHKRDLPDLPPLLSGGLLSQYNLFLRRPGAVEHQVTRASAQTTNASAVFGPNVRVVPQATEMRPQTEPTIAINPSNPDNVVIAYHDAYGFYFGISVVYSLDGGVSWLGPIRMPLANSIFDFLLSDPALAADRKGNFYLAYMSFAFINNDLVVAKSSDGGASWKPVVAVSRDPSFAFIYDKPWIAVGPDPTNLDRDIIYLSYTEFGGEFLGEPTAQIKVARSIDGGETWDEPVPVSELFVSSIRLVQGSMPAVDSQGVLYVAYYDSLDDGWTIGCFENRVAKSLDAGRTFATFTIAKACNELPEFGEGLGFRFWSSMFPIVATGPERNVYVVFAVNQPQAPPEESPQFPPQGDINIMFTLSTDLGETWTNLTRVNDDTTTFPQFFPWIAVDPIGIIHIIFGDTRDNPPEAFEPPQFPPPPTPPPRPVYHVYYSNSTDGGGTFLANGRVTDTPSVVAAGPFFGPPFIGDYFNVAVSRESVQVVWADFRLRSDIFTARMPSKPIPESFPAFLKPARGVVGTPVQLTGTASPNNTIQAYYDGTALGTAKADAEGSFSFDFIVPESIAAPNRVTAVDGTTGKLATTLFTIEPSLKILPSVALPGASISAIGTGYLPESLVFILFNKTLIAFAVTDVLGSFTFSFTRTPFSEEGDWEIRAQDISSPTEAKATLRIPISTNKILLQVNGTSATIVGRLQSVEGNVATVIIPGLGEVKATLQRQVSAVEATQSLSSNILILNVVTLVGAWAAVAVVILLMRTRKS